ncbi:unnamed protein product [Linum tenue]|uniref:Uncharacterized protein n=1 Tax=Linum tenue TaxID=586396 RepID=A0AAV0KJQ6_9ROSI|nr:unnamed protein product [Linum tenue]
MHSITRRKKCYVIVGCEQLEEFPEPLATLIASFLDAHSSVT